VVGSGLKQLLCAKTQAVGRCRFISSLCIASQAKATPLHTSTLYSPAAASRGLALSDDRVQFTSPACCCSSCATLRSSPCAAASTSVFPPLMTLILEPILAFFHAHELTRGWGEARAVLNASGSRKGCLKDLPRTPLATRSSKTTRRWLIHLLLLWLRLYEVEVEGWAFESLRVLVLCLCVSENSRVVLATSCLVNNKSGGFDGVSIVV